MPKLTDDQAFEMVETYVLRRATPERSGVSGLNVAGPTESTSTLRF